MHHMLLLLHLISAVRVLFLVVDDLAVANQVGNFVLILLHAVVGVAVVRAGVVGRPAGVRVTRVVQRVQV